MEHEIIGHSKKAIEIMKSHDKPFWDKSKEILIEVLIIVFAVSFAALIERTREHYKEKSEAKAFVISLEGDLDSDIGEIRDSQKGIAIMKKNYSYIAQLKPPAIDSIEKGKGHWSFNISKFFTKPTTGRYDGFKSSGKIQTIENESLRNDILTYYEKDLPQMSFIETLFDQNQQRLEELFINNANVNGNNSIDPIKLLTSERGKILLEFVAGSGEVAQTYANALKDAQKLKKEIDKEYK